MMRLAARTVVTIGIHSPIHRDPLRDPVARTPLFPPEMQR